MELSREMAEALVKSVLIKDKFRSRDSRHY